VNVVIDLFVVILLSYGVIWRGRLALVALRSRPPQVRGIIAHDLAVSEAGDTAARSSRKCRNEETSKNQNRQTLRVLEMRDVEVAVARRLENRSHLVSRSSHPYSTTNSDSTAFAPRSSATPDASTASPSLIRISGVSSPPSMGLSVRRALVTAWTVLRQPSAGLGRCRERRSSPSHSGAGRPVGDSRPANGGTLPQRRMYSQAACPALYVSSVETS
jgi:hypothetical protein